MDASIPRSAARILDFIGNTEAPHGYDTVYGNNRMPKRLTTMTLDEVIADGPRRTRAYRSSACGRYQFMTDTLKGLKKECRLSGSETLTPDLQDRLAFQLLKRRKWEQFEAGNLGLTAFAKNLAMEWASFPVLAATQGAKGRVKRGQSYYAGDGLNKALVHPEQIEALLAAPAAPHAVVVGQAVPLDPKTGAPLASATPPASRAWYARLLSGLGILPTPAVAAPVIPPEGQPTAVVRRVQEQLQALGYSEVGLADGIMGPNTRKAILAFSAEQAPPLDTDGEITDKVLAALAKAQPRPVSEERATATLGDLRRAGSEPAAAFHNVGMLSTILGLFGVGGITDQTGILDSLKTTTDNVGSTFGTIQSALGTIATILQWCFHHWPWFAVGFAIYTIYRIARAALEFVIMFRTGIMGRATVKPS